MWQEEKWLIKELLLLQYHVAQPQSCSVRQIYQVGSSLPGVLGLSTSVSQPRVKSIDYQPHTSCTVINHSHWSVGQLVEY